MGATLLTQSKQIINDDEAAEYLGFKPQTLAIWRMKGTGPAYVKAGSRAIRYRLRDLEAWLESNLVGNVAK